MTNTTPVVGSSKKMNNINKDLIADVKVVLKAPYEILNGLNPK